MLFYHFQRPHFLFVHRATRSLEFCIGLKLYDENLWAESKCNNPNPVYAKKRSDKQRNRRLYACDESFLLKRTILIPLGNSLRE